MRIDAPAVQASPPREKRRHTMSYEPSTSAMGQVEIKISFTAGS